MENYSAIKRINYYVHSMTIKNYHKNCPGSYSIKKKSTSKGYTWYDSIYIAEGGWVWPFSCAHVCVCVCVVTSVVSNSLQPYGLYSPPGSSVHGILRARILEWVAMPSNRGSFWLRDQTRVSYVSCIGRHVLCCCSVAKSENKNLSLWPQGLQYTRLPCPSLSPRVCSNSCPLSWWCYPTISSSAQAC